MLERFDVEIKRPREAIGRNASLDRVEDHFMLLNDCQPADALVVCEALVIGGDQANHLVGAYIFENFEA